MEKYCEYSKYEQYRIHKYFKYRQYSRVSNHKILQVQAVSRVFNPEILKVQAVSRVLPPEILVVQAVPRVLGPEILGVQAESSVCSIGPQNTASTGRIKSMKPTESQNAQYKHNLLASKPGVPAELPSLLLQLLLFYSEYYLSWGGRAKRAFYPVVFQGKTSLFITGRTSIGWQK